jgi:hypothetical protein
MGPEQVLPGCPPPAELLSAPGAAAAQGEGGFPARHRAFQPGIAIDGIARIPKRASKLRERITRAAGRPGT